MRTAVRRRLPVFPSDAPKEYPANTTAVCRICHKSVNVSGVAPGTRHGPSRGVLVQSVRPTTRPRAIGDFDDPARRSLERRGDPALLPPPPFRQDERAAQPVDTAHDAQDDLHRPRDWTRRRSRSSSPLRKRRAPSSPSARAPFPPAPSGCAMRVRWPPPGAVWHTSCLRGWPGAPPRGMSTTAALGCLHQKSKGSCCAAQHA